MITITVDATGLQNAFDALVQRLRDTSPLMKEVTLVMNVAVSENFEQGGRPQWQSKYDGSKSRLQDTSRLKSSITSYSDQSLAIVGTNVEYAGIHQFGGEIRPKKAKALRFGGRFVGKVTMPARPFLKLTDDDMREIEAVGSQYLASIIK